MKTKNLGIAFLSLMLLIINLPCSTATAQTTAFTYQGRLIDNGVRANGNYDLTFSLFDAASNGDQISSTLTNLSVTVSNGLFTTQLDFGANVFTNSPLWLEVGERTNGVGDFTTLSPRQELTAVPYAIQAANALTANSVSAANITGAISSAQLPSSVVTNGASGVTINGTFTGNGTGVTNILFSSVGNGALKLVLGQNFSTATYGVGSNTAFVVAADVNGDGKMDLISANANDNTLTVLTNNGSGIFVSNATYAVGNSPRCVAAADVNGDGKVDLISANYNGETLTVLTNNGSGIFGFNATINVGTNCIFVTAADLNGDGKPDLITANDFAHSLTVFMNNGSGVFGSNAIYIVVPGYAFPVGVAAADVNGDGKLDLISANYDAANLTVLTNDGSGNFTVSSSPGGIDYSESVAAADVNGDGKIDLISADSAGNELIVLINDGSGNFPNPNPDSYGLSFTPLSVVAADINGDGKPDLICVGGTGAGKLEILTNDGSGDFTAAQTNTVGANPKWAAAADINGDGAVDLISANSHDNSLTVLTQIPQIISTTALTFTNSQNDFSGAFTGDGGGLTNLNASQLSSGTIALTQLPASVITNGASGVNLSGAISGTISGNGAGVTNIGLFSLNSGGAISSIANWSFTVASTLSVPGGPNWLAVADYNGDGHQDLASVNYNANTVTVLTNDGSGNFISNATYSVGLNPNSIIAVDVNGDGKPDLIDADAGTNTLTVLTNDGHGDFSLSGTYAVGANPIQVITMDVNGDDKPDLISANAGTNTLTILTNNGFGIFGSYATYTVGSQPNGVAAADVNGDDKPDLISANYSDGTLTVLTNNGSGGFGSNATYSVGNGPQFVVAADVNGDGKLDLTVVNYEGNSITVMTNNGTGGFESNATYPVGFNSYALAVIDVNHDGWPDLVIPNNEGNTLLVMTNDGTGNFASNATYTVGASPDYVVTLDVNGDGFPDLITANYGDGTLTVLTNTEEIMSEFAGSFSGSGAGLTNLNASQISSGTFSGDGGGLTNLNASQISGTMTAAQLPDISQLNGTLSTAQLPSAVVTNNESGVALGGVNVNGNGKITGGLAVDAAAADAGVINSNTSLLFGGPGSGEGIGSQRTTNGPAKQYSLDFYTSSSQRMTILLNGNVGIGTNAPATLLDVAGNIHAAGTFSGNGSGLMNLNAAQISGVVTNNQNGVVLNGTFSGDGSGLTNTVTPGNYLFAYGTGSQYANGDNSFTNVLFNKVASVNGWTYADGNKSAFTNAQTGLYLIQYTVMAVGGINGTSQVSLNITVNGVEIPGSETMTTLPINGNAFLLSTSFIASLNIGDAVALQFAEKGGQVQLNNQGYGSAKPVATLTITRLH